MKKYLHISLLFTTIVLAGFLCSPDPLANRTKNFETNLFSLKVNPEWTTLSGANFATVQNFKTNNGSYQLKDTEFQIQFMYGSKQLLSSRSDFEKNAGEISTKVIAGKTMDYTQVSDAPLADSTSLGYVERYYLDSPTEPLLIEIATGSEKGVEVVNQLLSDIQWK